MTETPDLFINTAFSALLNSDLSVSRTPRTEYDYHITIDGKTYDAMDMYETLRAVASDDDILPSHHFEKVFKQYGILSSMGSSRWLRGARKGQNFQAFMNVLKEHLDGWRCQV